MSEPFLKIWSDVISAKAKAEIALEEIAELKSKLNSTDLKTEKDVLNKKVLERFKSMKAEMMPPEQFY